MEQARTDLKTIELELIRLQARKQALEMIIKGLEPYLRTEEDTR